jgi:hypothetical protein
LALPQAGHADDCESAFAQFPQKLADGEFG